MSHMRACDVDTVVIKNGASFLSLMYTNPNSTRNDDPMSYFHAKHLCICAVHIVYSLGVKHCISLID